MAGESVIQRGAYAVVQASASVGNGAVSAGAVTSIGDALAAPSEDYPLLDFKLQTAGTPVTPGTVDLYRRASDGANQSQPPTTGYLNEFVGSFPLSTVSDQFYYVYGVPNVDQADTYYVQNQSGATLTLVLSARGRSLNTAP